jgi:hypothetical protein
MGNRAEKLADRVEQGHRALLDLLAHLDQQGWETRVEGDGRTVTIVVHHVATMLGLEKNFIEQLASGEPSEGITHAKLHDMNAQHAQANADCTRDESIDLLKKNSLSVLAAIRGLSDEELDTASTISLHWSAPLTTQYFIEEHPLSHSYEHAAAIRNAAGSREAL